MAIEASLALARIISRCATLRTLVLENAQLRARDVDVLCDALKQQKGVTELVLSRNAIPAEGGVALAELLGDDNCTIATLALAWNDVSAKGACALGQALIHNNTARRRSRSRSRGRSALGVDVV